MKAVLLCAGSGSRLGSMNEGNPKCMISIQGQSLIERTRTALSSSKITDLMIITGYQADKVPYSNANVIKNDDWESTKPFYSCQLSREWVGEDDVVVIYGDIIFGAEDFSRVIDQTTGITILSVPDALSIWSKRYSEPESDMERFKVGADGVLLEIGSGKIALEETTQQWAGIAAFSNEAWRRALALYDRLNPEIRYARDMTNMLADCIAQGERINVIVARETWAEIDTPTDLTVALALNIDGKLEAAL